MFRRLRSGLPPDAKFPTTLKELGYFVNEEDEIRSVEKPNHYFKFFLNHNARINIRQRFEFNRALEAIIHERLANEGLAKINLPLDTPSLEPHVPIFVSPDLRMKSRIVIVFGEPGQDLGWLAGRVANGRGGVDKGSMVSVVRALKTQVCSQTDQNSPGIILANVGQSYWWPEEKRPLTINASSGISLSSLAHTGRRYIPSVNDIPGNRDPAEHIQSVFRQAVSQLASTDAKIDIVAIGVTCETVEQFLDSHENWQTWGPRISSMVLLGPWIEANNFHNAGFREFLSKRTRGYVLSGEPIDTPLATPAGLASAGIPPLGCPCYSPGELLYTERIFIQALDAIGAYIQGLALAPDYENEELVIAQLEPEELSDDQWLQVPDDQKPLVSVADVAEMKKEVKQLQRWRQFAESGNAPDTDSDSEDGEQSVEIRDMIEKNS